MIKYVIFENSEGQVLLKFYYKGRVYVFDPYNFDRKESFLELEEADDDGWTWSMEIEKNFNLYVESLKTTKRVKVIGRGSYEI